MVELANFLGEIFIGLFGWFVWYGMMMAILMVLAYIARVTGEYEHERRTREGIERFERTRHQS